MAPITLSRPVLWGIVVFVFMGILLPSQPLPAQSVGCEAVDQYDLPRECTFLEEHGHCLVTALEAYYEYVEEVDSFWGRVAAEVGVQVDLLACNVALPLTLIESITRL